MKRLKSATSILATFLAMVMLVPLGACNSGTKTKTPGSGNSQQVVTLSVLAVSGDTTLNSLQESRVQKEMISKTGVKVNFQSATQDKFNVLIAGGDLPDILRVNASGALVKQLIESNSVRQLDTLLSSKGKDILKNIPKSMELSKKYWSDGKNQTYFIPGQVGVNSVGVEDNMGVCLRWDYYKELGYPSIKTPDDLLNVLAQMVKLHPKTDDGKPVYGVSGWSDMGNWSVTVPMMVWYGYYNAGGLSYAKYDSDTLTNKLLDTSSPYWKCIDFYYKARKMGLLDPDAFIQKNADFAVKATNGQILYSPATWAMGQFNTQHAKDGKGYIIIPIAGVSVNRDDNDVLGWLGRTYCITKDCKNQDKAMDLLNYLYSYDGARTLYSGVKGQDWDVVNGVPKLRESTIQLKQTGGSAWTDSGIGFDENYIGISHFTKNPADGKTVDLFDDPSVLVSQMTTLQKDFSQHYGVQFPREAFDKLVSEKKSVSMSASNQIAKALIAAMPDDISRQVSTLNDLMVKDAAKIIMSGSDAAYEANKASAMQDFKNSGAKAVGDWDTNAWADAVKLSKSVK